MSIAGILAACGTSSTATIQTASKAFNAGGIWYQGSDDGILAKDEEIETVLVFDDGKVTAYEFDLDYYNSHGNNPISAKDYTNEQVELTYGDLNSLSDDEIMNKVKEIHEAIFDANKQAAIEECNAQISYYNASGNHKS